MSDKKSLHWSDRIEKTCLHCENFCFCIAKAAIDEFVTKVRNTALDIIGDDNNAKVLYKQFAEKCRKFDPIKDE